MNTYLMLESIYLLAPIDIEASILKSNVALM